MAIEENKNTDFMSRLLANVDPDARESLVRRTEPAPAEKETPEVPKKAADADASGTQEKAEAPAKAASGLGSAMPDFLKRKKASPGKKAVKRAEPEADGTASEDGDDQVESGKTLRKPETAKKGNGKKKTDQIRKETAEAKETPEISGAEAPAEAADEPAGPVDEAFLEELVSDMAVDDEGRYRIPTKRGHDKHLRFWFDPMSQKIWDGYADLIYRDELSVDNNAAHMLLLPYIQERFEGRFLFRNELNLLPLDRAELLAEDFRKAARALKRKDMQNPVLQPVAENITIDLLVPEEEYNDKYLSGSPLEKRRAVRENLPVAAEFYDTVAAYLEEMIRRYRPKGFTSIAISAPV